MARGDDGGIDEGSRTSSTGSTNTGSVRSYDIDSALLLAYPPVMPDAYMEKTGRGRRAARVIVFAQVMERFMYVATYALLPVYLTRYPLAMSQSNALIEIHAFGAVTYLVAFGTGLFAAVGVALYTWSVWLATCGMLGSLLVGVAAALAALQQQGRLEYAAEGVLATLAGYAALALISAASGGLRATLPLLGSWQFSTRPALHAPEASPLPHATHDPASTPVLTSVHHHRAHRRAGRFFMHLWFAENGAYALAVILAPWLAMHVSCFGVDTCYPLSYGVAAAASLATILVFAVFRQCLVRPKPKWRPPTVAGDPLPLANLEEFQDDGDGGDEEARDSPCKSEVEIQVRTESALRLLWTSFLEFVAYVRVRRRAGCEATPEDSSSLRASVSRLTPEFRRGCEALVRALTIFVPASLFWALYHQQATMWVYQATLMDCELGLPTWIASRAAWLSATIHIQAEQTIVARPLFSMAMLPVVAKGVLPALRRLRGGRVPRPSSLMIAGLLVATLSFAASAIVQSYVVHHLSDMYDYHGDLRWSSTDVSVLLQLPQYALMAAAEILFEPASIEYAMYGDSTSAARDLHGVRDARLVAVGFSSWEAQLCVGQVLIVLVVLVGRAIGIHVGPHELLYMLSGWSVAVLLSAIVLLIIVTKR